MFEKVFVKIQGGLGNQMFQYAFGLSLQKKHCKIKVYFDDTAYRTNKARKYELHNFGITLPRYQRTNFEKLFGLKLRLIQEKEDSFYDESLYSYKNNDFYVGWFQSYKYFENYRPEILQTFQPAFPLNEENAAMLNRIKSVNAVCLHVRRTDYLSPEELKIRGICNLDYYSRAIEYIKTNTVNPVFFVFSDDISWCKSNIKTGTDCIFVDINDSDHGFLDLLLMKNCRHNIIANSSFSWWGAWLNENKDKTVIAPKIWMTSWNEPEEKAGRDLIPPEWIRM